MADTTISATASAVQLILDTAGAHKLPYTLPVLAEHCICGEPMAGPDYRASVRRHGAEQVLLALGEAHQVPVPSAEKMVAWVFQLLLPDGEDDDILPPEELAAEVHALYAPVIDGLVDAVRLAELSYNTLADLYEDALEERNVARFQRDGAVDAGRTAQDLLRHRNKLYGRASAEIGAQRAQLVRAYELKRIAVGRAEQAYAELMTGRTRIRLLLGLDGPDLGASTLNELISRLLDEHIATVANLRHLLKHFGDVAQNPDGWTSRCWLCGQVDHGQITETAAWVTLDQHWYTCPDKPAAALTDALLADPDTGGERRG